MERRPPTSESARTGARFKRGDPLAVEAVRKRVRRTLAFRGYGIPQEDRRELEQVAMAQIWEAVKKPDFDPKAGFWGFVQIVVARRCTDWMRAHKDEVSLDASVPAVDPAGGPLEAALRREREEWVRLALESLPEGCRDLIRLHFEEDKSYAEAAEILGASEGALRVRMHRCIQRAQKSLRRLATAEKSDPEV